jgi:hydroxyethylthiazole kinase
MPAEGEMQALGSGLPKIAGEILERVRARRPRVHCITNAVAQTYTANVLLAAGAIPSMTIAAKEIVPFAQRADALLVNLGTFDTERQKASLAAIAAVNKLKKPWVLDPVFIDRSPPRAAFAKKLVAKSPRAIRLNQAEFEALAGAKFTERALGQYAAKHRTVIGMTGEVDYVRDAKRNAIIDNGHPLMAKVTAMGCAGSAYLAACLAVESDPWIATIAALIVLGVAGEVAAERAHGPGSFAIEIVDALHNIDRVTVFAKAKVN